MPPRKPSPGPSSGPAVGPPPGAGPGRGVRLYGWRSAPILAAAALSVASGFAQFSAIAALPDVAATFGRPGVGHGVASQVGLSGTMLALGLALMRASSLASLPLSAAADRVGRRTILLSCCSLGLLITAAASLSASFWWFVALFAIARPQLSAVNAVAGVTAAEETRSVDRAKAIALISAAYGLGAGIPTVLRAAGADFRLLFALALVPLGLLPFAGRLLEEPDRFLRARAARVPRARLWSDAGRLRGRLLLVAGLSFAIAFVTGPLNSNLFVYAEGVLGLPPSATAALILAAAPIGVGGLLAGRWAGDHLGRRVTAGGAQVAVAAAGAVTYSGTVLGVVIGSLAATFLASAYAPPAGALATELFPTRVRATAAGWCTVAGVLGAVSGLLAFGLLADALGGFGLAAIAIVTPVALSAVLFLRLPETRGLELEASAPEASPAPATP
jgi:MFS family permease